MTSRARNWLIAASLSLAAALVYALLKTAEITPSDIIAIVGATPMKVMIGVVLLTLCNQMISVFRWRLLSAWFAPEVATPNWIGAAKATFRGAFIGQFVPLQLAMPLTRWASFRNSTSVNATLYEQLFDFILLGAAALAALALLYFEVSISLAIAGLCAAVGITVLTMPLLLGIAASIGGRFLPPHETSGKAADHLVHGLTRASRLPIPQLFTLATFSVVRLAVLSMRTVIVVGFAAGAASVAIVAVGYPIVGLALGVPFLPSGLGVADWSIAGLVFIAGGTVAAGAAAALTIRVLNIAALGLLLACIELIPMPKAVIGRDTAPAG